MSEDHSCFESRVEGSHLIITLNDGCFVDDDHILEVGKTMREAVDDSNGKFLLINMSKIKILASSMIGQFIQLRNKCNSMGMELQISDLSDSIAEAISIMHLNDLLNVFPSEADALNSKSV